jgi:hypothetical protein
MSTHAIPLQSQISSFLIRKEFITRDIQAGKNKTLIENLKKEADAIQNDPDKLQNEQITMLSTSQMQIEFKQSD